MTTMQPQYESHSYAYPSYEEEASLGCEMAMPSNDYGAVGESYGCEMAMPSYDYGAVGESYGYEMAMPEKLEYAMAMLEDQGCKMDGLSEELCD